MKVVNRIIAINLRSLIGDHLCRWVQWLPWEEFYYNFSFVMVLKTSPFHVVYGCDPLALLSYEHGVSRVTALDA